VEVECAKYHERMNSEQAACRHPADYCKFRSSCIIHFLGSERRHNETERARATDGPVSTAQSEERSMTELNFAKGRDGLLPAIVQDCSTGEVLMLAYINEESWRKTLATGQAHFWSRSRNKLWLKGETSGHVQLVREVLVDCDLDTVVFKVEQVGGAACHEGYRSCFFRRVDGGGVVVVGERVFDPAKVYKKER
jgi:phosphoribosyl-AMP cyclohydrolase